MQMKLLTMTHFEFDDDDNYEENDVLLTMLIMHIGQVCILFHTSLVAVLKYISMQRCILYC